MWWTGKSLKELENARKSQHNHENRWKGKSKDWRVFKENLSEKRQENHDMRELEMEKEDKGQKWWTGKSSRE